MTDKPTTSDQLKTLLGGNEKDWKRVSKSKNKAGQWVRTFENKNTGTTVEVLEVSEGQFMVGKTVCGGGLTAKANENFKEPSTRRKSQAAKYYFGIDAEKSTGRDWIFVYITPAKFFDRVGYVDDQTPAIQHLLPGCGTEGDSLFSLPETIRTVKDAAKYLSGLGFTWTEKFQDFIDSSVTNEIKQALQPSKPGNQPSPKG